MNIYLKKHNTLKPVYYETGNINIYSNRESVQQSMTKI